MHKTAAYTHRRTNRLLAGPQRLRSCVYTIGSKHPTGTRFNCADLQIGCMRLNMARDAATFVWVQTEYPVVIRLFACQYGIERHLCKVAMDRRITFVSSDYSVLEARLQDSSSGVVETPINSLKYRLGIKSFG